ncbi:MAG TPA: hypothetical protein VN033_00940 [Vulgatibacter sp.]|nr:hypothetical protein [Vulgatibacter sp.]
MVRAPAQAGPEWLAPASLHLTAAWLGAGLPWAWGVVALAVAANVARARPAQVAVTLPYCLFGMAVALGVASAWPSASGLATPHAWAMVRPAIAILLVGAVAGREWGLTITFASAAAVRAAWALALGGAPAPPFLAAAGLLLAFAAWGAGAIAGRWRILAGAASLLLAAGLWAGATSAAWAAIAVGLGSMAALGRIARPLAVPGAALAIAAAVAFLAPTPSASPPTDGAIVAWGRALDLLAERPAGIGAGNFESEVQGALAARGLGEGEHPRNAFVAGWTENGPLGLVAAAWIFASLFAALRRGWKALGPRGGSPRDGALVLGLAGIAGALLAWSLGDDPLGDPVAGYAFGFLMALGLAAAGEAGGPSPIPSRQKPLPRLAAGGAAIAIAGAAVGGAITSGDAPAGFRVGAASLLAALAILRLPWLRVPLPAAIRGLAIYCGAVFLALRAFAAPLEPGSALWWRSPSAVAALCGLGAAVAGAGHAIRRPGSIGPAPVAGAIACLFVIGFVSLLHYGVLAPGFVPTAPYNFAVASCLASLLFVAWSGPLSLGLSEVDRRVRRLAGLPEAAVASGLLAALILGWR